METLVQLEVVRFLSMLKASLARVSSAVSKILNGESLALLQVVR